MQQLYLHVPAPGPWSPPDHRPDPLQRL